MEIVSKPCAASSGFRKKPWELKASFPPPGGSRSKTASAKPARKLIEKLVKWLVGDKYMKAGAAATLREELLTLKYLGSRSAVRARDGQEARQGLANATALLAAEEPGAYKAKPKRGRPEGELKVRAQVRRWRRHAVVSRGCVQRPPDHVGTGARLPGSPVFHHARTRDAQARS